MKKLWLAITLAALLGGGWFGLAAWRAHKNLVTLDVRNAPLRDVIRQIERQTWETIQLDKRLDGRVTLKLKNAPLAKALDGVAEAVGARAQTVYAVYRWDYALKHLQTALDGEKIDSAGWTNLAPRSAGAGLLGDLKPDELGKQGLAPDSSGGTSILSGPVTLSLNGDDLAGGDVEKAIKQQLDARGLGKLIPEGAIADALKRAAAGSNGVAVAGSPRVQVMTLGPDGKLKQSDGGEMPPEAQAAMANAMRRIKRSDSGGLSGTNSPGFASSQVILSSPIVRMGRAGPDGTFEEVDPGTLSSERIVIETELDEKLTPDLPVSPTREAAAQAARKVQGRCATLYALAKSDLPVMLGHELKGLTGQELLSGADGKSLDPAAMADRLAQGMRREKAEQYQKLTPEQRAQRARDLRTLSGPANTNP